jgi:hypothetical protein
LRVSRRPTNPDGTKVEKRRSQRFLVMVPVEVSWPGPDGIAVKADGIARQVNCRGGFLEMQALPEFGSRVSLTNFLSAQTVEARVLATPQTRAGIAGGVAVELVHPSEEFWGVDLQVKKTSVELHKLETALNAQGVDLRLLSEFRDAVEYIRGVSAVAQRLREVQLRGRDEEEVHSEIATERVRRATKLCREIAADLDSAFSGHQNGNSSSTNAAPNSHAKNSVAPASAELDELRKAFAQITLRMKRIQSQSEPANAPAQARARDLVTRS